MAEKGTWVKIHRILLTPDARAPQVPEDTRGVPMELWVKGFLEVPADIGDEVTVTTMTGRRESGTLVEIDPTYTHSFGNFIPELLEIGISLKCILWGGDADER